VITVVGLDLGSLLGGTVIVETIFAWPGMGRLVVQALDNRDFPLVQGGMLAMDRDHRFISIRQFAHAGTSVIRGAPAVCECAYIQGS
jgi:ABC-type antimicrobial peptide transport system permease subunit